MKGQTNTDVMDRALSIAMVAAIVNIIFSTLMPCFMKKTKPKSLLREIKVTFLVHRHVLVASSVVTAIMVYFAVKMEPEIRKKTIPGILSFFLEK
mgnify:CR=1 FL=1